MFGLSDIKQIYHEALFQLALKNNIGGKIGEIANNVIDGLSKIYETIGQVKEVVQSFTKERELFLLLSKEFKKYHIIIIDDLERMSDNLKLEDVFGIIEELKQCTFVKVILIANLNHLEDKETYKKYKEKVIDREYHITEYAEEINWSKLRIHADFITEFLKYHKVKNLRTLQKAQNYFEDVKLFCDDIENEQFIEEVRLICFAIVVESFENLYYKKEEKNNNKFSLPVNNALDHRIVNYLTSIKSSRNLFVMLLKYYNNEVSLSSDKLKAEYNAYRRSGEKPNFYRTDEEIKRILPNLKQGLENAETLGELNKIVDEYVVWSDILKEENDDILEKYRVLVRKILEEMISEGNDEFLSYSHDLFHISSEKVKKIYSEERDNMKEFLIDTYISYLENNTHGKQAFDYSYNLRRYSENIFYKDIVKKKLAPLYNKNSFPIDLMSEEKYHTCYNIMYVLYHADNEQFLQYCEKLKQSCDNMAAHRVTVLIKEIVK